MEGSAKDPKPEQIPAAAPATATGGPLPGAVLRTRTLQRSATGDRVVLRSRTPHPRSGAYLPRGEDCQAEEDLDLEPLKARRAGRGVHMLCWSASSSWPLPLRPLFCSSAACLLPLLPPTLCRARC